MGQNFILKNVLFISNLKCNLISLGQIEAKYFVTLFNGVCKLQDPISRTPIGMGEWRNEIFIYGLLQLSSLFSYSANSTDSYDLWHGRLGHPSHFVLNEYLGQSQINVSSSNKSVLSVCRLNRLRTIFL